MHHTIAKTCYLPQCGQKVVRQDFLFVEDNERVETILWRAVAVVGNNVMGNVKAGFNRYLKKMLGALDLREIGEKIRFR